MKQNLHTPKMKLYTILFLLWIFLYGCSSTYSVRSTEAEDAYSYEQMNEKLKGQNATIELRDGREMYAKEVQIANDSVSGVDVKTDVKSMVSIEQLGKIIIKDKAQGALEGLLLGSMPGLLMLVGGIGVIGSGNIAGEFLGGILIFAGIIQVTLSLLIGLLSGHSDIYEFPIEQPTDSLRNKKSP